QQDKRYLEWLSWLISQLELSHKNNELLYKNNLNKQSKLDQQNKYIKLLEDQKTEMIEQLEQAQDTAKHDFIKWQESIKVIDRLQEENEQLKTVNHKLVESLEQIQRCSMSMFSNKENMILYVKQVASLALEGVKGND